MRFAGVYLSHNPRELKIERRKNVSARDYTLDSRTFLISDDVSSVLGKGELFGENCMSDLAVLQTLRKDNKISILAMPNFGAHPAVLTKLLVIAGKKTDRVEVEFGFRLTDAKKHPEITFEDTYYALAGESLWEVSEYYGADINELVRLNPQIPDIRDLRAGEEVKLR